MFMRDWFGLHSRYFKREKERERGRVQSMPIVLQIQQWKRRKHWLLAVNVMLLMLLLRLVLLILLLRAFVAVVFHSHANWLTIIKNWKAEQSSKERRKHCTVLIRVKSTRAPWATSENTLGIYRICAGFLALTHKKDGEEKNCFQFGFFSYRIAHY